MNSNRLHVENHPNRPTAPGRRDYPLSVIVGKLLFERNRA